MLEMYAVGGDMTRYANAAGGGTAREQHAIRRLDHKHLVIGREVLPLRHRFRNDGPERVANRDEPCSLTNSRRSSVTYCQRVAYHRLILPAPSAPSPSA